MCAEDAAGHEHLGGMVDNGGLAGSSPAPAVHDRSASAGRESDTGSVATHGQDRHHRLRRVLQDPIWPANSPSFSTSRTHLDGVYCNAELNPLPQEEFAALQRMLVTKPR